jgi:hypothetical protein
MIDHPGNLHPLPLVDAQDRAPTIENLDAVVLAAKLCGRYESALWLLCDGWMKQTSAQDADRLVRDVLVVAGFLAKRDDVLP